MKIFGIIIIILIITVIILSCCSKDKFENFTELDFSCEAIQNKSYHPKELQYKSQCPNLVIVEKHYFGNPIFYAEFGDERGPYFSQDYVRYYYLGISPDGIELDLEYDMYSLPWYNPNRWFGGRYRYYRPLGYKKYWKNRRNNRKGWKNRRSNEYDLKKQDYERRIQNLENRIREQNNRNNRNINKQVPQQRPQQKVPQPQTPPQRPQPQRMPQTPQKVSISQNSSSLVKPSQVSSLSKKNK